MTSNDQNRVSKDTSFRKNTSGDNGSNMVAAFKLAAIEAAHETYIQTISKGYEEQIQRIESEHAEEITSLKAEHHEAIGNIKAENDRTTADLRVEHDEAITNLRAERDQVIADNKNDQGLVVANFKEKRDQARQEAAESQRRMEDMDAVRQRREQGWKISSLEDRVNVLQRENENLRTSCPQNFRQKVLKKAKQMSHRFQAARSREISHQADIDALKEQHEAEIQALKQQIGIEIHFKGSRLGSKTRTYIRRPHTTLKAAALELCKEVKDHDLNFVNTERNPKGLDMGNLDVDKTLDEVCSHQVLGCVVCSSLEMGIANISICNDLARHQRRRCDLVVELGRWHS